VSLKHWSRQNACPTVPCCCANQVHSRHCVTTITPMDSCLSYRCAVTKHQCTPALFRAKCIPHCSVLCVTEALVKAKCLPHYSLLLCKPGSQQALCHCSYTYGDLPFTQVCSEPTPMHSSTVQGKMHSPLFPAAVQTRLTAGTVSLQLHLWRFAFHTGVQ